MKKILLLILFIGGMLRLVSLDKFPSGFTPDEASFGYDAYSIIHTGRDQWGASVPMVLKSFGDYKAPLYTYLTIPTVSLLGLNTVAVRLPNAILGTFAILVTYLLLVELKKHIKGMDDKYFKIEIVGSLLLAISPWHIMLSRGAFEANLTTFFLPLGILLFYKGLSNGRLLVLSALVFSLNLFSYHSAKLVTPLVVFSLILVFWNKLRAISKKYILASGAILFVAGIVTAFTFLGGAGSRASEVSLFSSYSDTQFEQRAETVKLGFPDSVAKIFTNRYQLITRQFIDNYFSYFSFKYLFVNGAAEYTYGMLPGKGVVNWLELPLLLAAIVFLVRRSFEKALVPLFVWLLTAPIPAALTSGPGFAGNRAAIMLPVIHIISAFGAWEIYQSLRKLIKKYSVLRVAVPVFVILILSATLLTFYQLYFVYSPIKASKGMLYGDLEAVSWIEKNAQPNDKILMSRRLSEPQIYVAFATKMDPQSYQRWSKSWDFAAWNVKWVDQMSLYTLDKYVFADVNWNKDTCNEYNYVVGLPNEFTENTTVDYTIKYPDGTPSIFIIRCTTGYAFVK